MKKQYKIKPGHSSIMYIFLNNKIKEYEEKISKIIENKQKEQTEKFKKPYNIKLFHYFCCAQFDFICIQSLFNIPKNLRNTLFINGEKDDDDDDDEKYNDNDMNININNNNTFKISFISLTNYFPNV